MGHTCMMMDEQKHHPHPQKVIYFPCLWSANGPVRTASDEKLIQDHFS